MSDQWFDDPFVQDAARWGIAFHQMAHRPQTMGESIESGVLHLGAFSVLEGTIAGRNVYRKSGDYALAQRVMQRETGRSFAGNMGIFFGLLLYMFGTILALFVGAVDPSVGGICALAAVLGAFLFAAGNKPVVRTAQVQRTGIPSDKDLRAEGYIRFGTHPMAWVKPHPGQSYDDARASARMLCEQYGVVYDVPVQDVQVQAPRFGYGIALTTGIGVTPRSSNRSSSGVVAFMVVLAVLAWIGGCAWHSADPPEKYLPADVVTTSIVR